MKPAEPIVYECRPGALKRAVTNLIDNAVKYGNTAHVAINPSPRTVEITIDDEGPGISEPELSRVFEPFYRLEESRNRNTGGIALGPERTRGAQSPDQLTRFALPLNGMRFSVHTGVRRARSRVSG